ncbi:MAG TPA: energy transducer TonB [Longimicrobiaceae bacterium]|nr:energy transducer TonB [Longimicrobiaceae bacterium]
MRVRTLLCSIAMLGALIGCHPEARVSETPPRRVSGVPFRYPEDLWDAGVEGETVLKLFIGEQGGVDTVRVERTSGYPAFDSAAVVGARTMRFEPAHRGADVVGTWVLLPVQFDLPAADSAHGGSK